MLICEIVYASHVERPYLAKDTVQLLTAKAILALQFA